MATGDPLLDAIMGGYGGGASVSNLQEAIGAGVTYPRDTYYGQAGNIIGASTPHLMNPYGSTGSNMAIGIGGALLGAILSGMGQREANTENQSYYSSVSDFMGASPEQQKIMASNNPKLGALAGTLGIDDIVKARALAEKIKTAEAMIPVSTAQKLVEQGALAPGEAQAAYEKAALNKKVDLLAQEGKIPDFKGGEVQINDPIKLEAARVKAVEEAKRSVGEPEKQFDKLLKIQGTLTKAAENYQVLDAGVKNIEKTLSIPGRAADKVIIVTLAKMSDPTTGVRTIEEGGWKNNPKLVDLKNEFKHVYEDNQELTFDQRKRLLDIAKNYRTSAQETYSNFAKSSIKLAEAEGLGSRINEILPAPLVETQSQPAPITKLKSGHSFQQLPDGTFKYLGP